MQHCIFNSIYFVKPNITNSNFPQRALQSVHIRHPCPRTSHRIRNNSCIIHDVCLLVENVLFGRTFCTIVESLQKISAHGITRHDSKLPDLCSFHRLSRALLATRRCRKPSPTSRSAATHWRGSYLELWMILKHLLTLAVDDSLVDIQHESFQVVEQEPWGNVYIRGVT